MGIDEGYRLDNAWIEARGRLWLLLPGLEQAGVDQHSGRRGR